MAAASSLDKIVLPPLNLQRMRLILVGDTPLIVHAWSSKAKAEILGKQMGKAKSGRVHKDPDVDFLESLYPMHVGGSNSVHIDGDRAVDGTWGFPVIAFKAAAVTACTSTGSITKVQARQAFHVLGDVQTEYEGKTSFSGELVQVFGSDPRKREDMVRVGMGTADIRFRGEFWPWYVNLAIRYNGNVLSAEQIANLFNTAGFGVGIGEWRSEKDGMSGLFHVADEDEYVALQQRALEETETAA